MPLVISLRAGDRVLIQDQPFIVDALYDDICLNLRNEKPAPGAHPVFKISDKEAVEVMPDVFVSTGDVFQTGMVRVVFDAPRSIQIRRGERRESKKGETA